MSNKPTGSKQDQIAAFNTFCASLLAMHGKENLNRDCYFSELIERAGEIALNIKSDFPILHGIATPQAEVDQMQRVHDAKVLSLRTEIATLNAQLRELEQFDVRALRAKLAAEQAAISEAEAALAARQQERDRVEALLNGTEAQA